MVPALWAEVASTNKLPVMSGNIELARGGTLMAYGPKHPELFRRATTYVDKILRGARPADLPVEQPTEFDFVINLKIARALGLSIPDSVVKQATEIVQ
jgi:putative ABC transport system substrate-binding protein